jgi:hypothetical protein
MLAEFNAGVENLRRAGTGVGAEKEAKIEVRIAADRNSGPIGSTQTSGGIKSRATSQEVSRNR